MIIQGRIRIVLKNYIETRKKRKRGRKSIVLAVISVGVIRKQALLTEILITIGLL